MNFAREGLVFIGIASALAATAYVTPARIELRTAVSSALEPPPPRLMLADRKSVV